MRQRAFRNWSEPTERSNASELAQHVRVHLDEEMRAFDRLPKAVAKWLDDAPRKYSAVEIERMLRSGGYRFNGEGLSRTSLW